MTNSTNKLLEILFPKKRFKDKAKQDFHEEMLWLCDGYRQTFELLDKLVELKVPLEDVKREGNPILETLVDNYEQWKTIERWGQRVLYLIEIEAPQLIINNEYHRFFERVIKLLGIEVTDTYREEIEKVKEND